MATSQLRDQVQLSLGAAYTIERELGGGGMSRVFVAEENALGRKVVIKVLPPELAEGLSADRFAREIRLAARLQHPHIVPLFSAGTIAGLPYYTMPYVDGESLRSHLAREKSMPAAEALHVLRDTARALEYAHAHDVVHRDIKPDNILLSGNSACVIDFGIAKAVSAARTQMHPGTGMATQAGFVVGTPAYMAPEQATADANVDGRADIYAFGCVAFELFAGKPPFPRGTPREMMLAHIAEPPSSATLRRLDIPRSLVDLVMRCLEKMPEDRPQNATELLEAIESTGNRVFTPSGGTEAPASIAVLAFDNMSGDKENEYFADGITEEIINSLTQVEGLRVAGRTSSFSFKGTKHDLPTIGEKLNVLTVLEGSVRKAGNRLRITAQLIKVSDGYHLWSERYDRELLDVFAVQEEIATAIALKLRLSLGHSGGIVKPRTTSIEAYQEYLRGRGYMWKLGHMIYRGISCFHRAIELDENFAFAHAAMADGLLIAGYYGLMRPADVIAKSHASAMRAMQLDPNSSETRHANAFWMSIYGSDSNAAVAAWERTMVVGSQFAQVRCNYAIWGLCLLMQRWDDAVEVVEEGLRLDPLNGFMQSMSALVRIFARRTDGFLQNAQRGVEIDPDSFWGQWSLQRAYQHAGKHTEAIRQAAYTLATSGRHPWSLSELAVTYASIGNVEAADAIYAELVARNRIEPIQPSSMALAATCAGKLDDAITLCHRAIEERDAHIRWAPLERWEGWSPLYSHPGWEGVRQRIIAW